MALWKITYDPKKYNVREAIRCGISPVWPVKTGKGSNCNVLHRGDKVYIVESGLAIPVARCEVTKTRAPQRLMDLPGYGEGLWDAQMAMSIYNVRNIAVMGDVEVASSRLPVVNGRFTAQKSCSSRHGLVKLTPNEAAELDEYFPDECARAMAIAALIRSVGLRKAMQLSF